MERVEINLDKYYTPPNIAEYVINKTNEVVGEENITEFLEPSAGGGVFLQYLNKPYKAYDISPEEENIIKQDYLDLDIKYKKGRCIIGNPPFGRANSTLKRFFKKSIELGDYISFILPISQYQNNNELYNFDLIYSEDLGDVMYSKTLKRCCLNIYKKPIHKKSKPKHEYEDIEIVGWRKAKNVDCDFYICCYGSGVGKIVDKDSHYVNINGIVIKNKDLKERVFKVFEEADWAELYPMMSSPNLLQWQIYKHLSNMIPELK